MLARGVSLGLLTHSRASAGVRGYAKVAKATPAAAQVDPAESKRKTKKIPTKPIDETVPKRGRGRATKAEPAPAAVKPTKAAKAESKKTATIPPVAEKPSKKVSTKAGEVQSEKATAKSPAKSKATTKVAQKPKSGNAAASSAPGAQPRTAPFRLSRNLQIPVPTDIPRGPQRKKLNISVGDTIHGFKVVEKQFVPDRNLTAYLMIHDATGARHLHLECDDMENAFCTTFKTIPENSKGIPHVLEHLSLCGSKTFPVRDSFFNLSKRSLSTYMNASTGVDYISYPFASQNINDFYNIMAVYLDAMYFPKLEYLDFLQEGYRLDYSHPEDPFDASEHELSEHEANMSELANADVGEGDIEVLPVENKAAAHIHSQSGVKKAQKNSKKKKTAEELKYKGIVFNEMKGALSDSNDLFITLVQQHLFPKTPYRFNQGGNPEEIVEMSHEELLNFHDKFYHPSNSFSFTYGDIPVEYHLKFMNERALNKFTKRQDPIEIPDEQRFTRPTTVTVEGPMSSLGDPDKQNKVTVAWLTNKITQQFESSCMYLLSLLLLHGPNAPLYQALIASNLGSGYSTGSGYAPYYREAPFQIGLNNVAKSDMDKIEKTILATLEKVAETGFPKERVDSLLHQLELDLRTVTTGFGVALASMLTNVWIHGGSPVAALQVGDTLERLKRELAEDPQFFQKKIRANLLNNKHRLTFKMIATPEFSEKQGAWEAKKLKKIQAKVRRGDINASDIKKQSKELERRQASAPDVKILPKLDISAIDVKLPAVEVSKDVVPDTSNSVSVPIQWIPQPTNGIVYFRAKLSLDGLPEHLIPYVPLFSATFTHMGTEQYDYMQFAQLVESTTGSFSVSHSIVDNPSEMDQFAPTIWIQSSALERNVDKMFDLWRHVLQGPRFHDTERLKTILSMNCGHMHDSLLEDGSTYASLYAASRILPLHNLKESWSGLTQYNFLRKLEAGSLDETVSRLKEIAAFVLDRSRLQVAINAEEKSFSMVKHALPVFIDALNANSHFGNPAFAWQIGKPQFAQTPKPVYLALPIQINYVTDVFRGVPYTHEDFSKVDLMTAILSPNYLHQTVREKGGAYGAGVFHNDTAISFYSYRDPAVRKTITAFDNSLNWIASGNFTSQQVEDAKMSLFGQLDAPVAPRKKGLSEFVYGLTHEDRQKRRERLLAVSRDDIIQIAEKYLSPSKLHSVAVFGSETQGKEFQNDPNWEHRTQ